MSRFGTRWRVIGTGDATGARRGGLLEIDYEYQSFLAARGPEEERAKARREARKR